MGENGRDEKDGDENRNDGSGIGDDRRDGVVTLEAALRCLVKRRRRHALYYLREHRTATVDELATGILERETGRSADEIESEEHASMVSELVHVHLPHLADSLAVEYDPRSETVRYADPPELLDQMLELIDEFEREIRE